MSKTHPSCATLNTEKTYFETCAHNRWRFSDFLKHCGPDHERLEAGCKWMQALESIIDEGNAEYRGTAQRLLNRHLDIQHAEKYFKTVQPALWDINEFLFHNENAAKRSDSTEANSLLCDAWVRGLRQASEDTERTECDRLTARRLLNKYSGTVSCPFDVKLILPFAPASS